jgi:integrase
MIASIMRDDLAEDAGLAPGHFRNRVWYPAVAAAGIRRFPPRIMRHTAASWLVQDGVPLYDVQTLLGMRTTPRHSGTRTSRPTRIPRCWSPGLGGLTHG